MEEIREMEGFVIDNDNLAEWALGKLQEADEEENRMMDMIAFKKSELEAKAEEVKQTYENKRRGLESALRVYFESVPHKETKTQSSYKLLSGSLVMKKASKSPKVVDEAKLIDYLTKTEQQDFIKVEKKPCWGEFKKSIQEVNGKLIDPNGEAIPEDVVALIESEESFSVKR